MLLERGYAEAYSTVAGTVTLYVVPGAVEVQVVVEDVETEPVVADAVVSGGRGRCLSATASPASPA